MTKWEYRIFTVKRKHSELWSQNVEYEKQLNQMGKDGWELITVVPLTGTGTIIGEQFYLKRKIEDTA